MQKIVKRFIAGAVCPKCSQMDKIVMFREDEKHVRECVACGYRDVLEENPPVAETGTEDIVTRVTPQDGKVVQEEGEQVLKIFDSPTKH